jgi:opacity protein-like surface antigen
VAHAQVFFNAGLGTMNYAGDLLDKSITFSECKYSLNIGAGYQFAPHFVGNLNLTFGKVGAKDTKNGWKWVERNLNFQSYIYEAAITAEYDLFDIRDAANPVYLNTEQATTRFTPYAFVGIGIFNFNPYTFYNGQKVFLPPLRTEAETTPYSLWALSIPFGIGVKYALTENIFIGAEMNIRKTNTDYMDDVSHFNFIDTTTLLNTNGQLSASLSFRADEKPNSPYPFYSQRGNPDKKDVFYTFAAKIIFTFGEGTSLFKYGYGE